MMGRFSTADYVRLHGAPKIYYSSYSEAEIAGFGTCLAAGSWCVFDNTASGSTVETALRLRGHRIGRRVDDG
jgi:uncharacterized protein YecE (DUF72 family)